MSSGTTSPLAARTPYSATAAPWDVYAEERTGARLRKIYSITDAGEQLFQKMIRDTLTLPPHTVKSDFSLGLVWIESIPKQEAVELLQQNLKQVEASLFVPYQWTDQSIYFLFRHYNGRSESPGIGNGRLF